MADLNELTRDICKETKDQGIKLEEIADNVSEANDNIEGGNKELKEASAKKKTGNKCLYITLLSVVIFVILLAYLGF